MSPEDAARAVRLTRRRLGLTQVQLALILDVTPRAVRRWERCERRVPGMVLLVLVLLSVDDGALSTAQAIRTTHERIDLLLTGVY